MEKTYYTHDPKEPPLTKDEISLVLLVRDIGISLPDARRGHPVADGHGTSLTVAVPISLDYGLVRDQLEAASQAKKIIPNSVPESESRIIMGAISFETTVDLGESRRIAGNPLVLSRRRQSNRAYRRFLSIRYGKAEYHGNGPRRSNRRPPLWPDAAGRRSFSRYHVARERHGGSLLVDAPWRTPSRALAFVEVV